MTTTHTLSRPVQQAGYLEVGPIIDQNGLDVGPLVAARMIDDGVADARVVEQASGKADYMEGSATIKHDKPSTGLRGGAIALLVTGCTLAAGAIVTGVLSQVSGSSSGYSGCAYVACEPPSNLVPVPVAIGLGIGAAATLVAAAVVGGTTPPGRADATVDAKLLLRRTDNSISTFTVEDKSFIYFKRYPDLGLQTLDGLSYGMSWELLHANGGRPASAPPASAAPPAPAPEANLVAADSPPSQVTPSAESKKQDKARSGARKKPKVKPTSDSPDAAPSSSTAPTGQKPGS
jgi:hypothetical protein